MDSENEKPIPVAALASGRFSGRESFERLVRDALAHAARAGWQEIILSDATFEDWPLRERAVVESLHAWSKSGRRMTLLATRYDEVTRRHARFVSWRTTWGHILDCRVCREAAPADFPSAIVGPDWYMHRQDVQRSVITCGHEREPWVRLREVLDERMRDSEPGFASSILGL